MSVIEFQNYIDQGTIEVPRQYLNQVQGGARVIILTDEDDDDNDMAECLLDQAKLSDFFRQSPLVEAELDLSRDHGPLSDDIDRFST